MAISITFNEYLSVHNVNYELIKCRSSSSHSGSSFTLKLPTEKVVKTIILQSQDGQYLLATLPADSTISINEISKLFAREFHLVNEWLLNDLSPNYQKGAIPNIGTAHKMRIMIDNALLNADQVYIAAEDCRYLLLIDAEQYQKMQALMPPDNVCGSAIGSPQFVEQLSVKANHHR